MVASGSWRIWRLEAVGAGELADGPVDDPGDLVPGQVVGP
jgi:hypothetical protein